MEKKGFVEVLFDLTTIARLWWEWEFGEFGDFGGNRSLALGEFGGI